MAQEPVTVDHSAGIAGYCREIETYLCQRNSGHLIRIVGPAFELVSSWAERGIPLKVAFRGIDRHCERVDAKRGRRRPVRIEFCEADVLDAFDDWRRAVGVTTAGAQVGGAAEMPRRPALAAHIERAIAGLRTTHRERPPSAELLRTIEATASELDGLAADARTARGDNRARIVERLASLDRELLASTVAAIDPARARRLMEEAEAELAPFGARMIAEARQRATEAAFHRLVREAAGVPTLAYE
jgi:hypothetical protein